MKYYNKEYCINCDKYGHNNKRCIEPITSLGIVAFKIDFENLNKDLNLNFNIKDFINKCNDNDNILKINNNNYNNLKNCNIIKKYIKFLLISRKNSLGYIEFIRGNYNVKDEDAIKKLIEQMTAKEINKLNCETKFEKLWLDMWGSSNNNFNQDYFNSFVKFQYLKKKYLYKYLSIYKPKYEIDEWGFPKGRRNLYEKNIDCAKREFNEETSIDKDNYQFINTFPLTEMLIGTNNIEYKHIYYLSICNNDLNVNININNKNQIKEIGNIGWFDYNKTMESLRCYHFEKKKIINNIINYITNIIML